MLRDQRAAFLKQQARVQAANVTQAASAAPRPLPAAPAAAAAAAATPSAPTPGALLRSLDPSNWKQDADLYAARIAVQKLPIGQKIKKIIELLFKERRPVSAEEIQDATFVEISTGDELHKALRINPKIEWLEAEKKYRYKAKHELKGKDDLLRLIREFKDGIPTGDVKDAYPEVLTHVQELKAASQIWVVNNTESHEDILYPNDPRIPPIRVDAEVRALVLSVELPRDFLALEKELAKSGQKPATSAAKAQQQAITDAAFVSSAQKPKQKRRRESSRTRYTNAHLPELFKDV